MLTQTHADGVPVKVRIDRNRSVFMEDLDDVGLVEHRGRRRTAERVMTSIDHRAVARGIDRGSVGHGDVHRVLAVGSDVRDPARIGLRDQECGPDRKGRTIGKRRIVFGIGRTERRFPGVRQRRVVAAQARSPDEHGASARRERPMVIHTLPNGRDSRFQDRDGERSDTQTGVHGDEQRRIGIVSAFDGEPQRADFVANRKCLARWDKRFCLVGEHPMPVHVAIFIGGLRGHRGGQRQRQGSQHGAGESGVALHSAHAVAIACLASSRFASASTSE